MRKTILICCSLLLALPIGHKAIAQNASKTPDANKASAPPVHYYRLDFVLEELDASGKPVNSRSYSMTATTERGAPPASIRVGSKLPITTGTADPGSKFATQYQYMDVDVKIDAQYPHEVGSQLAISLSGEVTSPVPDPGVGGHPVTRQNAWQSEVLIPIGKPTMVVKSDNLDNKGSMEVMVTATPLD